MKKLKPFLGFELNYDENGNVEVNNLKNYPQETKNCQEFFERLELIKIDESKITFPTKLKKWSVTINPHTEGTIMEYFNIQGIKKVVEENKSKLIDKITFIKPSIIYPKKAKYPNLIIHFYQVVDEGGENIFDDFDLVDYSQIFYENVNQFTKKRIANLDKLVNTKELFQIPYLPIELVTFDDMGNIRDFTNHILAENLKKRLF